MAHITVNGVTIERAKNYHAPASSGSPERLDTILRRAERLVRDLAPPPDPINSEYNPTAADTELAVFEHLWERASYVDRDDVMQAATVYADHKALENLVRDSMGRFYIGPREIPPNTPETRRGSSLHNVSPEPLW